MSKLTLSNLQAASDFLAANKPAIDRFVESLGRYLKAFQIGITEAAQRMSIPAHLLNAPASEARPAVTSPEQIAMLRAILEEPSDNVRRLAYADWLEEFGRCDRDKATVEFIRASCSESVRHDRMPLAAYEWLERNWLRLIPTLGPHIHYKARRGRTALLKLKITVTSIKIYQNTGTYTEPVFHQAQSPVRITFDLEFWRGFVACVTPRRLYGIAQLGRLLWTDQPLATLDPVRIAHDFLRYEVYTPDTIIPRAVSLDTRLMSPEYRNHVWKVTQNPNVQLGGRLIFDGELFTVNQRNATQMLTYAYTMGSRDLAGLDLGDCLLPGPAADTAAAKLLRSAMHELLKSAPTPQPTTPDSPTLFSFGD